ncbi:MAG: hypothetical protein HY866_06350, partial [Chloroflexi bacterium]|nr:hypothetical protein [Chloroflexota bacterium]
ALGVLTTPDGELVFEVPEKRIDLSWDDNIFSYQYFNENSLVNFVMGGAITWGPGAADDDCGFVLRMKDEENYFYTGIDQLNQVHYDEMTDGVWQSPAKFETDQIATGAGNRNELVVVWQGDTLTTLVNGQIAAQKTDGTLVEGYVGIAMDTFENSADTHCIFNNLWVWELNSGLGPHPLQAPENAQLTRYQSSPEEAFGELKVLGFIPQGGNMVFQQDSMAFAGEGFWSTPLAEDQPYTNVVMAGELRFTPGATSDTETCTLLARVEGGGFGADYAYFELGFNNTGKLYAMDLAPGTLPAANFYAENVDLSQPHHVLFILNDNTLTLFFDGQIVANREPIQDGHPGSYAASLNAKTASTACQINNLWVYQLSFTRMIDRSSHPAPARPTLPHR